MKTDEYKKNLEEALAAIKNNSDYLSYFEDMYIPEKIKKNLDEMIIEIEKTEKMINDITSNTVQLETGSNS